MGRLKLSCHVLNLAIALKQCKPASKTHLLKGAMQADQIVTKFGQDVRAQALKNAQDRLKAAAGEDDASKKKGGRG